MAQIRNTTDHIIDINITKVKNGKVIRLMPGLTPVDDDEWALALPLKFTRKMFDRKSIEGPTEIGDVKLCESPTETREKAKQLELGDQKKSDKKKSGKKQENFG